MSIMISSNNNKFDNNDQVDYSNDEEIGKWNNECRNVCMKNNSNCNSSIQINTSTLTKHLML
jgi:hypothetical protein